MELYESRMADCKTCRGLPSLAGCAADLPRRHRRPRAVVGREHLDLGRRRPNVDLHFAERRGVVCQFLSSALGVVSDQDTAADPAVIRLIDMAVRTATAHGRPISMCGQMCGNPLYTMLLLGIGLRSLSVTPAAVPEVKRVCRSVSIGQCERIAEQVRTLETARDVKTYLKEELSKVFPEFPV